MLPDLSVLWVIFFVLLSVAVLNGLVFKPLLQVMHERERAVGSARELAEKAAADARAATAEFEARTTAARAEVYREMEATRKDALAAAARCCSPRRGRRPRPVARRGAEDARGRRRRGARATQRRTRTPSAPPSSSACSTGACRSGAPTP